MKLDGRGRLRNQRIAVWRDGRGRVGRGPRSLSGLTWKHLLVAVAIAALTTPAAAQTRLDADGLPVVPPAFGNAPPKAAPAPPSSPSSAKPLVTDAEVEADKRRIAQRSATLRDLNQARDEVDVLRRAKLEQERQEQQALVKSQVAALQSIGQQAIFLRFGLPALTASAVVALAILVGLPVLLFRLFRRRDKPAPTFRQTEAWPRFQDDRTAGRRPTADPADSRPDGYKLADFMSNWERTVFDSLHAAIPKGWYICPQVRVADFVKVEAGANYTANFNRIKARSVDFLLIDARTVPRLVIELDDRTHDHPDRRKRDAELDRIYRLIGLPVAHVRAGPSPDWNSVIAQATGWSAQDDGSDKPTVVLRGYAARATP